MTAAKEEKMAVEGAATEQKEDEAVPALPKEALLHYITRAFTFVTRGSASEDERFYNRAFRAFGNARRTWGKFSLQEVHPILEAAFGKIEKHKTDSATKTKSDAKAMDVEGSVAMPDCCKTILACIANGGDCSQLAETLTFDSNYDTPVQVMALLFVLVALIDKRVYTHATALATKLLSLISLQNDRSMNIITARVLFFYTRVYELTGRIAEIHGTVMAYLRTASLRHDEEGQAVALTSLLRLYCLTKEYALAEKLIDQAPLEKASSHQIARYLYYWGRVEAVRLHYSDAMIHLQQAYRKAPQGTATGFKITVHKLLCLVQLLLGEIPDRRVFRTPNMVTALEPYAELVQAVHSGNLTSFQNTLDKHKDLFVRDGNAHLVMRLRHSVLNSGLRKLSLAYSRISLADIASRLGLVGDDAHDIELIVAKAIADGVIDARLDHINRTMLSAELVDIYATDEPHSSLHRRIRYCLDLHNDAVKALRFPERDAHVTETEEERERKAKEEDMMKEAVEEED